MTRIIMLIILAVASGCAARRMEDSGLMHRSNLSSSLARATSLLESGERAAASGALAAICNSSGLPGITDEALFRLALLSLRPAMDKDGNLQSLQLLKRLKKEYPASIWTTQSGPLIELLSGAEELRLQNRNLKSHIQSLSNEVNELNRNINKLKELDQELEKRRR